MSRLARTGASLFAAAVVLFALPLASYLAWTALRAPAHAAASNTDLPVALIRAGLDAEALAASGLTAQETDAVVDAFAAAMAADPGALVQADADHAAARVGTDALRRKVRSGLATPQEVTDLATAKTQLASAEAARADVLDDWFAEATANLSNAKLATLTTLRGNRDLKLPVEFLVKDRTAAEWHAIRQALANERIAPKVGDAPSASMQASLATWRTEAGCAAAKASCNANLAAVQSAWATATGS